MMRRSYALNAGTGALLWSYTIGSAVYSSPAVANGVVQFPKSSQRSWRAADQRMSTDAGKRSAKQGEKPASAVETGPDRSATVSR
jgi:outer membrane protein assembly factor BamB